MSLLHNMIIETANDVNESYPTGNDESWQYYNGFIMKLKKIWTRT